MKKKPAVAPAEARNVILDKKGFMAAVFVVAATLTVYTTTLPPTVTGEDSGELITAAYSLGVAHPPGYPLWCLVGKLFTLLPFGSVAWRVALMSALFGATASGLLCLVIICLTRSVAGGIGGGLVFAFSREYWEQSVIAEVYSLNMLIMLLCILLILVWRENRKAILLYLFALVYGLGMANHNTIHFLAPVFAASVFAVDRRPWLHWQRYLGMAGLALATWMLLNLYIPIRSSANPPVDWGNPETWQGFWDVILRQQYAFGFTENPRSISRFLFQCWTFAKLYSVEFTSFLAAFPLLGLYPLWKRHRYGFFLVTGLLLYLTLGFIWALNFQWDKESLWVNNVFFIPTYSLAAILIGAALAGLAETAVRGVSLGHMAIVFALIVPLVPLVENYKFNDKSDYWFSYDFGMNIFKTLDQGAVYYPVADHATFPLIYLQAVEGVRPDVIIGNKYGYPEPLFLQDMPYEFRTLFGGVLSERDSAAIEDWVTTHAGRPTYFTRKRPIGNGQYEMRNCGLLYKAVPVGTQSDLPDLWSSYEWHTLDPVSARGEYTAEAILADYYFFHGRDQLEKGNTDLGIGDLKACVAVVGDSKETMNNLGSACAEYGQLEQAAEFLSLALNMDPNYMLALQNIAKVYLQQAQYAKALDALLRVIGLIPDDVEARYAAAQCQREIGQFSDAIRTYEKIIELTPDDARVYRELGLLYLKELNEPGRAQQYIQKSLRLAKDQPELLDAMFPGTTLPPLPSTVPPQPSSSSQLRGWNF